MTITLEPFEAHAIAMVLGRRAFQWRGSTNAITWSEWRHLCFEDEEIPAVWIKPNDPRWHYAHVRVVIGDRVVMTSPIETWQ